MRPTMRKPTSIPASSPSRACAIGCIGAVGLVAALSGCGASFQSTYEGEARFEHCYALDEHADVARDAKERCWGEWRARYATGQNRDRIAYAETREKRLHDVAVAPTDEALMLAVPGQALGIGVATPAPTSADAPPPARLAPVAPVVSVAASDATPPLPKSTCTEACAGSFHVCQTARLVDTHGGGRADCGGPYARCMQGCFKK